MPRSGVRRLGLGRCGDEIGADGPDGFVGNSDALNEVRVWYFGGGVQGPCGSACRALCGGVRSHTPGGLDNAEHNVETRLFEAHLELGVHNIVGLIVEGAALGVSEYDAVVSEGAHREDGHLSSEGALGLEETNNMSQPNFEASLD